MVNVKVYDRDVVGSDDFMGRAMFDLTSLDLDKSQEVTLHLDDGGDEDLIRKNKKKKSLGHIVVRMVLSTLTKEEYNEVKCGNVKYKKYYTFILFLDPQVTEGRREESQNDGTGSYFAGAGQRRASNGWRHQ